MSATNDIDEELIERLEEKARQRGLSVNDLLREMINEMNTVPIQDYDNSLEAFEADLEALAEGTEHLPPFPHSYSREDIYFDHD